MLVILVILAAIGAAVATYLGLERLGPRSWIPSGFRALAWSTLGILLLDLSCQRPPTSLRPLVLLDASLSLGAAGGRWKDARAAAARLGEVRLLVISVTPTPGIVVVASPGSWESRFLYRTLSEVAALPVRGYLGLAGGHWRRMGDLAAVGGSEVDRAVEQADLLVTFGEAPDRWRSSRARGRWEWVATAKSAVPVDGEWYATATTASPVASAFVGLPIDSFPPGVALAALAPGPKDWVGLGVQQNRRGVERPAIIGRDSAGRREVLVGVAGLWRWAFRGGSSEQAYRALVGASASWLLGGSDPQGGRARPIRPVAEQGRPIVFERARPDTGAVRIELKGPVAGGARTDTLRFDGAGRAELSLPPGRYDYRLDGGGSGVVAVETYSSELLPHSVALTERGPTAVPARTREPLREKLWLFALAIVGFSGEWWWRRRAGLR